MALCGGGIMAPPVGGYQAWYDASQVVGADGASIGTWSDLSGNGYDLVQIGGTTNPVLRKTGGLVLASGLPVLQFAGSGLAASAVFSDPNTIFVVAQSSPSPGPTTTVLWAYGFSSVTQMISLATAWNYYEYGRSYPVGGSVDGNPHIFTGVDNGASSALRVDGSPSTGTLSTGDTGSALTVGSGAAGVQNWVGSIDEIIVYPSAISGANITATESYLNTKWLTAPPAQHSSMLFTF
jgi:hypothetical protein